MYFTLDNTEIVSKMGGDFYPQLFGTELQKNWKVVRGNFIISDTGSIKAPDISTWTFKTLVFNQKAHDALKDFLNDYGEMLEISIESKKYYMFNLINLIDDSIIDYDNSEKVLLNGVEIGEKKLTFNLDTNVEKTLLFKTSYDNKANTFCDETFKKLIEDLGLTGIQFETELAINPIDE